MSRGRVYAVDDNDLDMPTRGIDSRKTQYVFEVLQDLRVYFR